MTSKESPEQVSGVDQQIAGTGKVMLSAMTHFSVGQHGVGKWVSSQMNFPNTRKAKSSAYGFWMGAREQTGLGLKRPD